MEEIVDEQDELPAFLYAQLLRERTLLNRLAVKRLKGNVDAVDVVIEPSKLRNHWHMVFRGTNSKDDSFRVSLCIRRRGLTLWTMGSPKVYVNDVEDETFEGGLEAALAAALGGSGGEVGETQGQPAVETRGARSNAVETRRATVIRN